MHQRNDSSSRALRSHRGSAEMSEERDTSPCTRRSYDHDSRSKRVSFAEPLVFETHFRPKTLPEDIGLLFYTQNDMIQFRNECIALRDRRRKEELRRQEEKTFAEEKRKEVAKRKAEEEENTKLEQQRKEEQQRREEQQRQEEQRKEAEMQQALETKKERVALEKILPENCASVAAKSASTNTDLTKQGIRDKLDSWNLAYFCDMGMIFSGHP